MIVVVIKCVSHVHVLFDTDERKSCNDAFLTLQNIGGLIPNQSKGLKIQWFSSLYIVIEMLYNVRRII